MTHFSAENILLPLQKLQQAHDEAAHRDILNFDLYKRLKHMVLHFFKYAGKIEAARSEQNSSALGQILVDTYIICMASANAMNLSLGRAIACDREFSNIDALARHLSKSNRGDLSGEALRSLLLIGGHMAKAIESADHMERGDPRAVMESLVPQLATAVLGILGSLDGNIENDIKLRLRYVEDKSIFSTSLLVKN